MAYKNAYAPAVRRLACLDDVEASVSEALSQGRFFSTDIEQHHGNAARLALLHFLAMYGDGAMVNRVTLARQCFGDLDWVLDVPIRHALITPGHADTASRES